MFQKTSGVTGRLLNIWLILLGGLGLFIGMPGPATHVPMMLLFDPFCLFLLGTRSRSARSAFTRGWLLGLLGQSLALYWLIVPMTEVGMLDLPPSIAAVLLLGAYLSIFYGLTAVAALLAFRWFNANSAAPGLLVPLTTGLAFAAGEILCGVLFTGFPWLNLATGFAPKPVWIQLASVTGSYGLSALFAIAACYAALAVGTLTTSQVEKKRKTVLPSAFIFAVILLCVWGYGRFRLAAPFPDSGSVSVRFILVQGNIDQNQKWEQEYQQSTIDHYLALTKKGIAVAADKPGKPEIMLAVWPETAMPFSFETSTAYADQIRNFAIREKIGIGLGTTYFGVPVGHDSILLANRFLVVAPDGGITGHYDKEHLVPFGEYIPGPLDFDFLRNIMQGMYFTPGTSTAPIIFGNRDPLADAPRPPMINGEPQVVYGNRPGYDQSLAAGVLICYEAIFPELAQERVEQGADIIVNISNDGWFGKTAAPTQHLYLTAMRAVEQERYIVRSTNTGYTALVNPRGVVVEKGQSLYKDEVFVFDARTMHGHTVFYHIFDYLQSFLVVMPFILLILARATREKPNKHHIDDEFGNVEFE